MRNILYIILTSIICIYTSDIYAQTDYQHVRDSIFQEAEKFSNGAARLNYLEANSNFYQNTPIALDVCNKYKDEAIKQKNVRSQYYASEILAFLHLQNYDNKKLEKEIENLKKYAEKLNSYGGYIKGLNYNVILNIYQENYNSALICLKEMDYIATKYNHSIGKLLVANDYYSFYITTGENEKAYKYIKEATTLINDKTPLDIYISVYSNIIYYLSIINDYDNVYKYNREFDKKIQKFHANNPKKKLLISPTICKIELNYFYYFLEKENYKLCKKHLDKAKNTNKLKYNGTSELLIGLAELAYCNNTNQNKRAIQVIDQIEDSISKKMPSHYINIIQQKAHSLHKIGKYRESLEQYDKAFETIDSLYYQTTLKEAEIAEEYKEINNINIKNDTIKNNTIIISLICLIILSTILSGLLIFDYRSNIKTKGIEKKLLEIYNKSLEENIEIRLLKKEVSHAVRTPLNSIVGFADYISNSEDDEIVNNDEIKKIINNSSAILTNYINDILFLSRVESGKITFTKEIININDIGNRYISTNFTGDKKPTINYNNNAILFNTDPKYFVKILSTSIKESSLIDIKLESATLQIEITDSLLTDEKYLQEFTNIKWIINSKIINKLGGEIFKTKEASIVKIILK